MRAAIADASPGLRPAWSTKVTPHSASRKPTRAVTAAQLWLLLRRLCVLAAAILYVFRSIEGGAKAIRVLYGVVDDSVQYETMRCELIASFAGTATLRESPLVAALGGTARRNDTVFLRSPDAVAFDACSSATSYDRVMYGNDFLRAQYSDLARDAAYNITLLKTSELVAPVVDCSSSMMRDRVEMYMRVFYLVRAKADHDDVALLTYSFSMQDYRFPDQYQSGVAGMLVVAAVSDMRFQNVDAYYYAMALAYPFRKPSYTVFKYVSNTDDGFRIFESVPLNATTDVTREIYTSYRTGIFMSQSESEQSNTKNINAVHALDPQTAMAEWEWRGLSLVHDAWAWVHIVHLLFAVDMVFNLLVLRLVVFRNWRKGKYWIGDAFVSVSGSVVARGFIVLLAWYLDGFWTLIEFCLQEGKILSNASRMFIFPEVLHADLLVMYLSLAGLLGVVVRERIDPALTVFLFEIGFANRHGIVTWFPRVLATITDFYFDDAAKGIVPVPAKLAGISPLRFRTTHALHAKSVSVVFAVCVLLLCTFAVLVAYVPLRKVYHRLYPSRAVQMSRGATASTETDTIVAWQGSLTMFEVATGAALQNRVGLVSDYDNCVHIKGMKFASADGVFCNGFVVAKDQWLLRMADLPLILAMVVLRLRIADVYVYEVETFTVQKNARLFYPEMLVFSEVFQLQTMVLA